MKPTRIAIKHFTNEIVKRISKALSKEEITREEFDEVMNSIDKINVIVSKIEKGGTTSGKGKTDITS